MGWEQGERLALQRAGAHVNWSFGVEDFIDESSREAVWEFMNHGDIPTGWLPDGPHDPIIERAFADVRIEGPAADSHVGFIRGMGRPWPGDWDLVVMGELQTLEQRLGRRLQQEEIMEVVGALLKKYDIDKPFEPLAGAAHE